MRHFSSFILFYFCNKPIGSAHHSKKKKYYVGSPKQKVIFLKYRDPPIWPTYRGERRTTFAKAYGIKVRCYGEQVGEHIGNLGNIFKT
jgi:hypothetical protein